MSSPSPSGTYSTRATYRSWNDLLAVQSDRALVCPVSYFPSSDIPARLRHADRGGPSVASLRGRTALKAQVLGPLPIWSFVYGLHTEAGSAAAQGKWGGHVKASRPIPRRIAMSRASFARSDVVQAAIIIVQYLFPVCGRQTSAAMSGNERRIMAESSLALLSPR